MPEPFELSPEHQVRELLNMIMLLERCLTLPDGAPPEQAEWRADLSAARDRLRDLLAAARTGHDLTRRLATQPPPPAASVNP